MARRFAFGLMPLGCVLLLTAFVGVAGVRRIAHPLQRLVVELQPPEQFGELRFKGFLAHIFTAAIARRGRRRGSSNTLRPHQPRTLLELQREIPAWSMPGASPFFPERRSGFQITEPAGFSLARFFKRRMGRPIRLECRDQCVFFPEAL
jgi:hypothetical protein